MEDEDSFPEGHRAARRLLSPTEWPTLPSERTPPDPSVSRRRVVAFSV